MHLSGSTTMSGSAWSKHPMQLHVPASPRRLGGLAEFSLALGARSADLGR
jgi:hypothetical protein